MRKASVRDAPALAALHAESFGAARWSVQQIADSLTLETTQGWVADGDNAPLGFILCQSTGAEAEILTFCVSPAARRKGAGRALLEVAIVWCRKNSATRLFLEVASDNEAALALYRQAGFRVIGMRPDYYCHGDQAVDAVMMELILP